MSSPRATALPPAERRAAIVLAALPLMREHGTAVPTREIAAAAGIAEGTLFRAFPDKTALVRAVIDAAFDPAPVEQAVASIDPTLPFAERLEQAVAIMQRRSHDIWQLMAHVGPSVRGEGVTPPPRPTEFRAFTALLESGAHELTRPPRQAAQMLRALALALTHPTLRPDDELTPAEIVALFLDGVRRTTC